MSLRLLSSARRAIAGASGSIGERKPREEATPIHVADVARMTAALHVPRIDDSVSSAPITPRSDTPVAHEQGNITLNPDRREDAHEDVVWSPSSIIPGWNSEGRLATDTPVEKRRRLSQGLELLSNLQSEFQTPPVKRGRRKRKPDISLLFLLCLHLSCPQTYTQALKSPEHDAWKASMDLELHTSTKGSAGRSCLILKMGITISSVVISSTR